MTLLTEIVAGNPLVQAATAVCDERGVAACIVGGAMRDLLLGRPVHDWDFVVDHDAIPLARATANRLGAAFFPLDEERDTGRVVAYAADGTRTFLDFALRRGPDWRADLEVRDLTVNAIALPIGANDVIDLFGGQADLDACLIRAVTERSFRDDPVRAMRAIRLAVELNFQIEPQTATWIRRDACLLANTSAERVRDELGKLLARPNAFAGARQMDELDVLVQVLPEVAALKGIEQTAPHHWPVLEHTLFVLGVLERIIDARQDAILPYIKAPEFVWDDLARTLANFRGPLAAMLAAEAMPAAEAMLAVGMIAAVEMIAAVGMIAAGAAVQAGMAAPAAQELVVVMQAALVAAAPAVQELVVVMQAALVEAVSAVQGIVLVMPVELADQAAQVALAAERSTARY